MIGGRANSLSGRRKAAILLAVLGEEAATSIFPNLSEGDVEALTQELTTLGTVPTNLTHQVLQEYQQAVDSQEFTAQGGQDLANRLLVRAFGDSGAKPLMDKMARSAELASAGVDSLKKMDPLQLAQTLEGEHPQTLALILGHLEGKQASSVLMALPAELRAEAVRRLANLKQFSPEMADRVSALINKRLKPAGEQSKKTYSGFKVVAELMNRVDSTVAREILSAIEREEPNLAISIRDQMFTFEDFLQVPEQQMRELMAAVNKKTLVLALKGASEEMQNHIFRTMSSRAVEMLKEDSEVMGPVRSKEVAKAQQEIVATARKLESEGKLVLKNDGDDQYVV